MSEQVNSASGPADEDSSQLVEPVVDQQPSEEQPQEEEPPTEYQDISPGKAGEDEEALEVQGPGPEADPEEVAQTKTGGKGGDGPDVKEEITSNLEPMKMPEAGEGQPLV
uniref:GAGE domain-containing protein n=1 Tax=Catagonus wagneri TaxID=51154 RepID=A0A8C3W0Z8_9CETA